MCKICIADDGSSVNICNCKNGDMDCECDN